MMIFLCCLASDKRMEDTEARGSEVAVTNEPKDDRPGKSFPKKSKPETQNITQIAEEFKAGTRCL